MNLTNVKNKSFFVVDGNVGAGKTTFLRILQDYLGIHIVYEPTHKWQNVGGAGNLLENFYKDTPRWAYTFQSYAFVTRILEQEAHALMYQEPIHVLERSVFSDRYCFAKNCYELGFMSSLEWDLYKDWFTWLVDNYAARPQGFIYLRVDPTVCFERLKKRSRQEEVGISLDYLIKLHQKHEDWLVEKKEVTHYIKDTPVLTLNGSQDFENTLSNQQEHISKVAQFMDQFASVTWKKTIGITEKTL